MFIASCCLIFTAPQRIELDEKQPLRKYSQGDCGISFATILNLTYGIYDKKFFSPNLCLLLLKVHHVIPGVLLFFLSVILAHFQEACINILGGL